MTCDNTAGGVWTVSALASDDGIGNFVNFNGFTLFDMPTGQNGNTSGKHGEDNGGTFPTFTAVNTNKYTIGMDGFVDWQGDLENAAAGTAGAGAVNSNINSPVGRTPNTLGNAFGPAFCQGTGINSGANLQSVVASATRWNFSYQTTIKTATAITQNADLAAAARFLIWTIRYKAF
jgi:hypothetical protein